MNNKKITDLLLTILCLLPLVYLAAIWNTVPEIVPVHYGIDGHADSMGHKTALWLPACMISFISIGVYFLLRNIKKVDPKRANAASTPNFDKLAAVMVLFMTALNLVIVIASARQNVKLLEVAMTPLMGLMFMFIGNYMYNIKPNYFAGIKVPWALASDYNWKKTHKLGGTLWFIGGLIITISSLFLSPAAGNIFMLVIVAVMAIIPIVYSYLIFRKEKDQPGYFDKER